MCDSEHLEVIGTSNSLISSQNLCEIVAREDFYIELRKYYSGQSDKTKKPEWSMSRISQVINSIEEYKSRKTQKLKTTNQQYHYASKYDILDVGKEKILIMKRKTVSSPVIEIIPSEKYYDILMKVHIATGHGGRDKIIYALKEKKIVPQFAIKLFVSLCKICMAKRSFPKSGIVVRPLVSNDFNRRGQMDLIDLQSSPDTDFKWLLNYQDHLTKFCFLRPLKSKRASQIALELLKIFLEVGCPHILQSDNGREFTANVIKEIMSLWPDCKILNGRPRHPQSQGSVERCNQDVENMLRAWMKDNDSRNWSVGCYFVQFQKNTSLHRTIGRTPYKALFGHEPTIGLAFTHLPDNIIKRLENEEDLEIALGQEDDITGNDNDAERHSDATLQVHTVAALENHLRHGDENIENGTEKDSNISREQEHLQAETIAQFEKHLETHENNQNYGMDKENIATEIQIHAETQNQVENADTITIISQDLTTASSLSVIELQEPLMANNAATDNFNLNRLNSNAIIVLEDITLVSSPNIIEESKSVCHICNRETTEAHMCYKCKKNVHVICGILDGNEGYGSQILCNLCEQEQSIIEQRTKSYDNLKRTAEKMMETSSKKFKEIDINSTVLVEVPKVDRGPLDSKNLVAKVIDKRNGLYRVGTSAGIIKDWLPRNAIQSSPGAKLNDDIPDKILPLRRILSGSSQFGGQGFKMCNCSRSKFQCTTNRCACKKNNALCNSKCHKSADCKNK